MKLRKHQREILEYYRKTTRDCECVKDVIMHVTPGGGKSLVPKIAFHILKEANYVDKLLWVVPRKNLRTQGCLDLSREDRFIGIDGKISYQIYESTNEIDPSRGTDGYITTYQALSMDQIGMNALEIERNRYLVVLDEVHHVELDGKLHKALQPIMEHVKAKILMTGTLERGDKKPIAFIPYTEGRGSYAL